MNKTNVKRKKATLSMTAAVTLHRNDSAPTDAAEAKK